MCNLNATLTDDGYLIHHTVEMYEFDRLYFYTKLSNRAYPLPMNPVYWRNNDICEIARCESPIQRRLAK